MSPSPSPKQTCSQKIEKSTIQQFTSHYKANCVSHFSLKAVISQRSTEKQEPVGYEAHRKKTRAKKETKNYKKTIERPSPLSTARRVGNVGEDKKKEPTLQ